MIAGERTKTERLANALREARHGNRRFRRRRARIHLVERHHSSEQRAQAR